MDFIGKFHKNDERGWLVNVPKNYKWVLIWTVFDLNGIQTVLICTLYLIDVDDGERWNIVHKLFSGYAKYTFYNKTQIKNFRCIYFAQLGHQEDCGKYIYRMFFIFVLLWNLYQVYPEESLLICTLENGLADRIISSLI